MGAPGSAAQVESRRESESKTEARVTEKRATQERATEELTTEKRTTRTKKTTRGSGSKERKTRRAKSAEAENPSFEVALEALEKTVSRLEDGDLPLEEALELFETGVNLSRQCSATLEEAERRIEILVADRESDLAGDDDLETRPFESDEDPDEDPDEDELDEDPEDLDPEE